MYQLTEGDRAEFRDWFEPPGRWSAVRAGEIMRYWQVLVEDAGRVVLQHGTGAVGVLRLVGDELAEATLHEGPAAEPWLRAHGFPVSDDVRAKAGAALTPGRPLDAAMDQAFPRRMGLSELPPGPGGARRWRLSWGGVLEVDVDASGAIRGHRFHTGGAALDLINAGVAAKAFDLPTWSPTPIRARTRAEAKLFVVAQKSTFLMDREHAGRYEVVAHGPEGRRKFVFELTQPNAEGLGSGTSPAMDPAELVLFASRIASEVPADPATVPPVRRKGLSENLKLAAAALREVVRFVPPGQELPPLEGYHTPIGRRLRETQPDRFRRSALEAEAARLDELAARWAR